jgi:hypothetical protein
MDALVKPGLGCRAFRKFAPLFQKLDESLVDKE